MYADQPCNEDLKDRLRMPSSLIRSLFLVTDSTYFYPKISADFLIPFKNLQTLTVILKIGIIAPGFKENLVFPPEVDGELDLDSFSFMRRWDLIDEKTRIEEAVKVTKKRCASWNVPVLKWRLLEQFIEGIDGSQRWTHLS